MTRLFTRRTLLGGMAALGTLALVACAPGGNAPAAGTTPAAGVTPTVAVQPIKVALLPIVDSLPLHVAQAEGLFARNGVEVELITVASAQERTAAQQAGAVDASLEDLIGPNLLNRSPQKVQIVHTLYQATPERAFYSLVTNARGPQDPQELRGKRIAIASNTIAEYITDRLLELNGLRPSDVEKVEVPRIPQRAELVNLGQVDVAALVEPLATLVVDGGGRRVLDDRQQPSLGVSSIIMAESTIRNNPEGVRRYVAAVQEANQLINADPEKYRALLIEKANLPASLNQTFVVPRFPVNQVPTEAAIKDVQDWMLAKGLIQQAQPYNELVNSSFLPAAR